MKKVFVFFILLLIILISSFSQITYYRNNHFFEFSLHHKFSEFEIQRAWDSYINDFADFEELYRDTYVFNGVIGIIEIHEPYSSGTFKIKNNEITCYDPKLNRIYKFIIVDEYTLMSIKHTAIFKKGELLKMTMNAKDDYMIWKDSKRHGIWSITMNDTIRKWVLYQQDIPIDSIYLKSNTDGKVFSRNYESEYPEWHNRDSVSGFTIKTK